MRKTLVIMVALIVLLGIPGCGSVPATQETQNRIDATNACNIAAAMNAYNALCPSAPLEPDITLEDAKASIKVFEDIAERNGEALELWPEKLSDEEEKAAWKLIVIRGGEADLIPEAQSALQVLAREAYSIALAINAYDALNPSDPIGMLDNDITLEDVKERYIEYLWPAGLSDEEENAAWKLIVIDDWSLAADLTPEAQKTLQAETGNNSNDVKIANATAIATGINVYNALHLDSVPLPNNITLVETKKALGEYIWPSFLTDAEAEEAWELIEIKVGVATVKRTD